MVSSQAHAVRVTQMWLEHIYTRVSRVYIQKEGDLRARSFAVATGRCRPPQPSLQHSPSKGKEAKMTKKEFTRDKTNKQTNRKGRSSIWLSAFLFFQRACLLRKSHANLNRETVCFYFCSLSFFLSVFCCCMDTGKRSSISPTFGKYVLV